MQVASPNDPILICSDLTAGYPGRGEVLQEVNLRVPSGAVVALLAPNGAGKTTLLWSLLGLHPAKGSVDILGKDPKKARSRIFLTASFINDVASLPKEITIGQLAKVVKGIHPHFSIEKFNESIAKLGILRSQKPKTLSKGNLARLHLYLVLAINTQLLVLDEPFLGVDILARRQFINQLNEEFIQSGGTVLITTHHPLDVAEIATHLALLVDGKIAFFDSLESINERYRVAELDSRNALEQATPLIEEKTISGKIRVVLDANEGNNRALLERVPTTPGTMEDIYIVHYGQPAEQASPQDTAIGTHITPL